MPPTEPLDPKREERLDRIIAEFTVLRDSGLAPDPASWIRRHREYASELREYFGDEALIGAVSPLSSLQPGTPFADYQVVREISRRQTGDVYEAKRGETRVALKVYAAYVLSIADERARFRREAEALRELKHPNIVSLIETGEVGGVPYLAMPFIEGTTLAELFRSLVEGEEAGVRAVRVPGRERPESFDPRDARRRARAVAAVGIQAANGLDHAHEKGILHRDVKPGNLMIDESGRVVLTDFGLVLPPDRTDITQPGDIVGTHRYLSPERWRGWSDRRGDIYALGLTLYELATLRRVHEGADGMLTLERMAERGPAPPRRVDRSIPRDLETIILVAIQPDPNDRYSTARAMAEDLERFLDGEPIRARRPPLVRRLWRRIQRDRAAAFAFAASALLVAGLAAFGSRLRNESEFQDRLREIRVLQAPIRRVGWSDVCRELLAKAAGLVGPDRIRDEHATILIGFDTRRLVSERGVGGSSVVFDPKGERIALGGANPRNETDGRAAVWDVAAGRIVSRSSKIGPGPVAFAPDGTALHLLDEGDAGVVLATIDGGREVARVKPPLAPGRVIALAPDGSRFLVATEWGIDIYPVGGPPPIHAESRGRGRPTVASFSFDGGRVAVGYASGHLEEWTTDALKFVDDRKLDSNPISAVAFGRDPTRDGDSPPGWLIAAAEEGGRISVLDAKTMSTRTVMVANSDDVASLCFSADGMLLASCGRHTPMIWNPATGECLLECSRIGRHTGLTFSPDGRLIATVAVEPSGKTAFTLDLLENGRGVATLCGPRGPMGPACLSADGRVAAASSQDWGVSVWDLERNRLLGVFEGPRGYYTDNIGLALNPTGTKLVVCAGTEAQLWDVAAGRIERRWRDLPPGLVDRPVWTADGRIVLLRQERIDGKGTPKDEDWLDSPRLVRVRELTPPDPDWKTPLLEIGGYKRVNDAALTPDGGVAIIHGIHDDESRSLRCVEIDGKRDVFPPKRLRGTERNGVVLVDPIGETIAYYNDPNMDLIRRGDGALLYSRRLGPFALGPRGTVECEALRLEGSRSIRLRNLEDERSSFEIGIVESRHPSSVQFSCDGRRMTWGGVDAMLRVFDLPAVARELDAPGAKPR